MTDKLKLQIECVTDWVKTLEPSDRVKAIDAILSRWCESCGAVSEYKCDDCDWKDSCVYDNNPVRYK